MERPHPIVLLAATGYTGRLIARELDLRGARFAVAGRSKPKLDALSSALPSRPPAIVAEVGDPASLRRMAAQARVVLSCAGPFAALGPPVVEACLAERAHYLDITGETDFMRHTVGRDAEARAAGVVLVNAVGFDVVPTDLSIALACRGLGAVRQVEVALAFSRVRPSQGTLRSALGILERRPVTWRGGRWEEEPLGLHRRQIEFPPPLGRRWVASAPIADVVTGPRTSGARDVRAYAALKPWLARAARLGVPLLRAAARAGGRRLAGAIIARAPEGATEAERERARWATWAEARGEDGRIQTATSSGKDPYGFTAVSAAFAAQEVSSAGYARSGALSPMQAVDPDRWMARLREAEILSR